MIRLSKRAIQIAHPEIGQRDVNLVFLEYHYGAELSEAVRDYLKNEKSMNRTMIKVGFKSIIKALDSVNVKNQG